MGIKISCDKCGSCPSDEKSVYEIKMRTVSWFLCDECVPSLIAFINHYLDKDR